MPDLKPLPPGLDPVTAGRFGLWLLGQRSHAKAVKRSVFFTRVCGKGIVKRFATALFPWTVERYPGYEQGLAELMNVSLNSARDWLNRPERLPAKHAARLEIICRERSAEYAAIADEFGALAKVPHRYRLKRGDRGG